MAVEAKFLHHQKGVLTIYKWLQKRIMAQWIACKSWAKENPGAKKSVKSPNKQSNSFKVQLF